MLLVVHFLFNLLEFGLDNFLLTTFYLWVPSISQGPILIFHFISILVNLGNLPPHKIVYRNYKIKMKYAWYELRRWFNPERYPHYCKRIIKTMRVCLKKFHQCCLSCNLVRRCTQRYSSTLTVDGRQIPTWAGILFGGWESKEASAVFGVVKRYNKNSSRVRNLLVCQLRGSIATKC